DPGQKVAPGRRTDDAPHLSLQLQRPRTTTRGPPTHGQVEDQAQTRADRERSRALEEESVRTEVARVGRVRTGPGEELDPAAHRDAALQPLQERRVPPDLFQEGRRVERFDQDVVAAGPQTVLP